MRVVIFGDESLEPITVLNLPITERDMLQRRIWRVPVPEPMPVSWRRMSQEELAEPTRMRVVDIEFECFVRNSPRHGEQRAVFAFTRAADLAMLLNPAWLPGQRAAVDYLQEQNDRLTALLLRIW
jgi:hypothetical protein